MVRQVVRYPASVLRAKCRAITTVTDAHRQLAADMLETMRDEHGVGLAAPQVGEDVQLAVIDVSHNPECVSFFKVNGEDKNMVEYMPIVFINLRMVKERVREKRPMGEAVITQILM